MKHDGEATPPPTFEQIGKRASDGMFDTSRIGPFQILALIKALADAGQALQDARSREEMALGMKADAAEHELDKVRDSLRAALVRETQEQGWKRAALGELVQEREETAELRAKLAMCFVVAAPHDATPAPDDYVPLDIHEQADRAVDAVQRLRARADGHARRDVGYEWKPVATIPKDGTSILGYFPDITGYVARQDVRPIHWVTGWPVGSHDGRWRCSVSGHDLYISPTHWTDVPLGPRAGE